MPASHSNVRAKAAAGTRQEDRNQLLQRVRGEFESTPRLRLTAAQVARLVGLAPAVCSRVLATLLKQEVLWRGYDGRYALRDR